MKVKYRRLLIMLIVALLTSTFQISYCFAKNSFSEILSKDYKYIVLSIEGGGVRGIIPARILQEIEERTGRQIYKMFDFLSGTSTGAVIALALVTPHHTEQKALYDAKDLVELYKTGSKEIFKKSFWWQVKTGKGLWGAKYDRSNLDKVLEEKFGNHTLSSALKPVMVVSYSIDRGEAHLWTSRFAKAGKHNDFFLKDIAAATSAAPTYFEPKKVANIEQRYCYREISTNKEKICYEADGGIFANNPNTLAISEVFRAKPSLTRHEILLVSIGTGNIKFTAPLENLKNFGIIGWVMKANLIDVMMNSESEVTEWESELDSNTVRLQVDINKDSSEMDNVSEENINKLLQAAENYIKDNDALIDVLCKKLVSY